MSFLFWQTRAATNMHLSQESLTWPCLPIPCKSRLLDPFLVWPVTVIILSGKLPLCPEDFKPLPCNVAKNKSIWACGLRGILPRQWTPLLGSARIYASPSLAKCWFYMKANCLLPLRHFSWVSIKSPLFVLVKVLLVTSNPRIISNTTVLLLSQLYFHVVSHITLK